MIDVSDICLCHMRATCVMPDVPMAFNGLHVSQQFLALIWTLFVNLTGQVVACMSERPFCNHQPAAEVSDFHSPVCLHNALSSQP